MALLVMAALGHSPYWFAEVQFPVWGRQTRDQVGTCFSLMAICVERPWIKTTGSSPCWEVVSMVSSGYLKECGWEEKELLF